MSRLTATDTPSNSARRLTGYLCLTAVVILSTFLAGSMVGCKAPSDEGTSNQSVDHPVIAVSTYPLKYFCEQIAGDLIEVQFPLDTEDELQDPANWNPSVAAVRLMQKADRVFVNGAGYEKWLPTVTLSESSIIDTSHSIRDRLITLTGDVIHQHGPQGDRSGAGTASRTWLNPEFAIIQARCIADELIRLDPKHSTDFEDNFSRLEKQLRGIRQQLLDLSRQVSDCNMIAAQPVYQYLGSSLNLAMATLNATVDVDLSDEQWTELDKLVTGHETSIILSTTPLGNIDREALQRRNVAVVLFDPMDNTPAGGDYVSGMLKNIENLQNAL